MQNSYYKYCSRPHLLADQVLYPSDIEFKGFTQSCTLTFALILIMTSQPLKSIESFKI